MRPRGWLGRGLTPCLGLTLWLGVACGGPQTLDGHCTAADRQAAAASQAQPSAPVLAQVEVLKKGGKPGEALELLRRSLAATPDDIGLHRAYQDLMRAQQLGEGLRAEYQTRAQAQPQSALAQYLYGRSILLEAPTEAEAALRRSRQLDPTFLWSWLALGALLRERGDAFSAIQIYEEALKQLPGSSELYNNLATTRFDIGAYREALSAAERVICLEPTSPVGYLVVGRIRLAWQDLSAARPYLEKAHSLAPDRADPLLALAELESRAGAMDKARGYLSQAEKAGGVPPEALKKRLAQ